MDIACSFNRKEHRGKHKDRGVGWIICMISGAIRLKVCSRRLKKITAYKLCSQLCDLCAFLCDLCG